MTSDGTSIGKSLSGYFGVLGKLLTFRATREDLMLSDPSYLYLSLLTTWIVGIGRFWDNPRTEFYRHLGLGSLVYVPILAFLLYIVVLPYGPRDWTYRRVLTFVAMTAPPGLLYAIPAQKLWGMEIADVFHVRALGIVAVWRVALLFFYFRRFAALNWFSQVVCTLLPLSVIVSTLAILNLDRVVFAVMSGVPPESRSANDASYTILLLLTLISMIMAVPLFIGYVSDVFLTRKDQTLKRRKI